MRALLTACLLLVTSHPLWAQEARIALVIGNSTYGGVWPDLNGGPLKDAQAMRQVLQERLGFQVMELRDADQRQMEEGLAQFRGELQKHPGALALVFYAGHGAQAPRQPGESGLENYLIPARTDLRQEADARYKAIAQERIEDAIREGGAQAGVIILDACRDNGLERGTRGVVRGLSGTTSTDILVAYSAASGHSAYNVPGQESVFTRVLVEEIVRPGQITDVMYRVRARVIEATRTGSRGPQEPELLSKLGRPITLVAQVPSAAPPSALEYRGGYNCALKQIPMTLRVEHAAPGVQKGVVQFSTQLLPGVYTVEATIDPVAGRMKLQPVMWLQKPPGYEFYAMAGGSSDGGKTFSGLVLAPGCSGFQLTRVP